MNVEKLEKSWNTSIRRMFNLPLETHCYLVEPLSDSVHAQTLMARRFIRFVNMIRSSKKHALRSVLKVIEFNTRSVTGHNLRSIILKTKTEHLTRLKPSDVVYKYRYIPDEEFYRVDFTEENIKVKNSELQGLL